MAWETGSASTNFNAQGYVDSQIDQREGLRNAASSYKTSSGGGFFGGGYSLVGMDVSKVPAVINKMDAYIKAIEQHLDGIQADASPNGAYKGEEVQAAVRKYIEKVQNYCVNLCSQLRAFEDRLKAAQEAWETATKNIAESVNTSNGSFSEGTYYQRQR